MAPNVWMRLAPARVTAPTTVALSAEKPAFRVLVVRPPASVIGRLTTVPWLSEPRNNCSSAPGSTVSRAPDAGARSSSTSPKVAPLPAVALPVYPARPCSTAMPLSRRSAPLPVTAPVRNSCVAKLSGPATRRSASRRRALPMREWSVFSGLACMARKAEVPLKAKG